MTITEQLTPVMRLNKDLANAAKTLSAAEARFLVDHYYMMQDQRIRTDGQIRAIQKGELPEPHAVLSWFSVQNNTLEDQIKRALEKYVDSHIMGGWFDRVYGIGPIIAAGLIAHVDINKAPTVGHIWRYAGLDPTVTWEKGKKRPWNSELKVVCWKAGQSFMKFKNNEDCFYGHLYAERKAIYVQRNESGLYRERSAEILSKKNFKKTTDAYKAYIQGIFPPAHIDAMARRYAVKIFLSHMHGAMYHQILKMPPPKPFAIAILNHAHMIDDPHHV